ncbi:MAG: TFIIB-type zinc finger domain-containing protein [Clostridiales bacterium]|jgi:hypothetical protein|nr:TFIIB-type zinc finger domain-containing protein [Clostridiales bacterium]
MSLKPFECKKCGATLEKLGNGSLVCRHCGTIHENQDDVINVNTTNNITNNVRNENHFYGATVLTQAQKDNVEGYFFRLIQEYKQGNFIDAKKFLDKILETDPLNPDADIVKAFFNEFFRMQKVKVSFEELLYFVETHIIKSITQSAETSLWIFAFEMQKYMQEFTTENIKAFQGIIQRIVAAARIGTDKDFKPIGDNARRFLDILARYVKNGQAYFLKKIRRLTGWLIFFLCVLGAIFLAAIIEGNLA